MTEHNFKDIYNAKYTSKGKRTFKSSLFVTDFTV